MDVDADADAAVDVDADATVDAVAAVVTADAAVTAESTSLTGGSRSLRWGGWTAATVAAAYPMIKRSLRIMAKLMLRNKLRSKYN